MQFGAHLPTYWDHYGTSDVRTAVTEAAAAAEALGYDSVWANDLVVVPAANVAGANAIEPLITLASLIHRVPRLRLGTSVLVLPQRNAVLVAKQAAALDLLSGGRLILGVGIGHREAEFAFLGANFAHRAAATDEAIEVLQTLWREPEANYQGRFHRLDAALMLPKPASGGPPIWVGGESPGGSPQSGQVRQRLAALPDRPRRLPVARRDAPGLGPRGPLPPDRQGVQSPPDAAGGAGRRADHVSAAAAQGSGQPGRRGAAP
jgi:probable F420-dependent oxidoreductase